MKSESLGEHFENPHSLELAKRLEEIEDPEQVKSLIKTLFEDIEKEAKVKITSDISHLYQKMNREKCLARIERLSRVLEAIELDTDLIISEASESHYANAVIPEDKGIALAFAEGRAPGIRSIIGFGKTMVGFKADNLEVLPVEFSDSEGEIRDISERQYLCRHVNGKLRKQDIKTVIMRIPRNMFPESQMTEAEIVSSPPFVFRGFEVGVAEEN